MHCRSESYTTKTPPVRAAIREWAWEELNLRPHAYQPDLPSDGYAQRVGAKGLRVGRSERSEPEARPNRPLFRTRSVHTAHALAGLALALLIGCGAADPVAPEAPIAWWNPVHWHTVDRGRGIYLRVIYVPIPATDTTAHRAWAMGLSIEGGRPDSVTFRAAVAP